MGADLVVAYFGIKKEQDLQQAKEKMMSIVDELSKEDFADYFDSIYGDDIESIDLNEAREEAKEVIERTFESLDCRDVTAIEHKGDIIYLSGGMSWGDSPTDSYDLFRKFSSLPEKLLKTENIC